jgi:hypothetical protein
MEEIRKTLEYLVASVKQRDATTDTHPVLPHENVSVSGTSHTTTESIILDEPMDINLVRRPANDITTTECKINNIIIPKTVLDGGAQCTIMSKKLAKRLGLKIDKNNPPPLKGVATDAESFGWSYNVPISFANLSLPRNTDFTLMHDVIISDYDKYALILGTDWLDLAAGKIDWKKRKFHVGNTFVPISVHKTQNRDIKKK